jgi:hypothetical protein
MKGLYLRPLIQTVINKTAFSNGKALGAVLAEYFGDELPRPTLALVLTAVSLGSVFAQTALAYHCISRSSTVSRTSRARKRRRLTRVYGRLNIGVTSAASRR